MNHCKVIYSVLEDGGGLLSTAFWGIAFSIIFIGIYLVVFLKIESIFKKIFTSFMIAWGLYVFIPYTYNSTSKYLTLKNLYNNKNYKMVAGKIRNYKSKSIYDRFSIVSFEVNNTQFSYSSVEITGGYHKAKNSGSILKNNIYVKIRYMPKEDFDLKNPILYLEVCSLYYSYLLDPYIYDR